jgi:uncharacterized protein YndB with AHSA1/START domain
MSAPTAIDATAPVAVQHSVEIAAPAGRVWSLLTEVNDWTRWQTDITDARSPEPLAPGTAFTWTSFEFTVTSTVYALDPGSRILWGGDSGGITGIHEWTVTPTPAGCRVTTAESFSGPPVPSLAEQLKEQLDFSLVSWLDLLKKEAEQV